MEHIGKSGTSNETRCTGFLLYHVFWCLFVWQSFRIPFSSRCLEVRKFWSGLLFFPTPVVSRFVVCLSQHTSQVRLLLPSLRHLHCIVFCFFPRVLYHLFVMCRLTKSCTMPVCPTPFVCRPLSNLRLLSPILSACTRFGDALHCFVKESVAIAKGMEIGGAGKGVSREGVGKRD